VHSGDAGLPSRWDEMHDREGAVRADWREVDSVVSVLGESGLADRRAIIARLLQDDGVGYRVPGSAIAQPWTLDPLPLLIAEADWQVLEVGLRQRAELLDAVLTDLYSTRSLVADGLLPAPLVYAHDGFLRAADQIRLPGPRQLLMAAADLGRDASGRWIVLSDRVQAPSGAGYAMENRSVISRILPRLYRSTEVHRIAPFFQAMRQSLQRLAPSGDDHGRVVLLTPGALSETAFDQAFLSSLLGFPLVEGSDLLVRDGRVWQRSLDALEPVDVIVRRVDAAFCDPLELRPDSRLGVPGLVEAARAGTVSIVNSLGSGILENPGLFGYLPAICEKVLGVPLALDSAPTFWCGDPSARKQVLARLRELVIKPISRGAGQPTRFGWQLSESEREDLARRIEADPTQWVGQEPIVMSTAPTVRGAGLEARSVALRTFAVADGTGYRLMPGGLARASARTDAIVVSTAEGAVSKDVWVLSSTRQETDEVWSPIPDALDTLTAAVSPRVAEDLYWLGRYMERAEGLARLLKVCDNRWRDLHPQPDPALAHCLVVLLEALTSISATWPGFVGEGAGGRLAAPQAELLSLIGDDDRVGSLAFDLGRIRQLANAVRDQLSNDSWMVLGTLDRVLTPFVRETTGVERDPRWRPADEVSAALSRLLEALLAFSGLTAESMVRDTGWYLLDAGRRLERALQITGLLRACLAEGAPPAAEDLVMESVLIAAESVITHRRRYPARSGVETVLALLLSDHGNPRSVAFQLDRLAADLAELPTGTDATDRLARRIQEITLLLAGADSTRLAGGAQPTAPSSQRRPALIEFLDTLADELMQLSTLLDGAHFVPPAPLQSLEEFAAAGSGQL
jgi:uncharacterized circularly permuted ATP-grasp superfamily protein/uncharacterized alpha-E superfamily protein